MSEPCSHCGGTGKEPPAPDPCVIVAGSKISTKCSRGFTGCTRTHERDHVSKRKKGVVR